MAGRKRKPPELHVVQGTFRPDRHQTDAPPPSPDLPVAPDEFDAERTRYFNRIVARHADLGLASASYQQVYEMVAIRCVEVDRATKHISDHNEIYLTDNGMLRANPAVAQRSEALRHLQSLYAELGLTPAARGKVGGGTKQTSGNPFIDT